MIRFKCKAVSKFEDRRRDSWRGKITFLIKITEIISLLFQRRRNWLLNFFNVKQVEFVFDYLKIFLHFELEPLVHKMYKKWNFIPIILYISSVLAVRWKNRASISSIFASRKVNRFIKFTLPLDNAWQRVRRVHSSQLIGSMTAFDKRYQMTRSAFCFFSPPLFLVIHRVTSTRAIRNLLSAARTCYLLLTRNILFEFLRPSSNYLNSIFLIRTRDVALSVCRFFFR